jgi:hypothetical protein
MKSLLRRAATGALTAATLAGCESTKLTSSSADRIIPTVTVSVASFTGAAAGADSANLRKPLTITVTASDNAVLASVVTRVLADGIVVQRDSVSSIGSNTFSKTLTVPLAGVRPGQRVTVQVLAYDGTGNVGTAEVSGVAFDPAIPRVSLLNAEGAVITGGTYTFQVTGLDSLGVSKLGYRASGNAISAKADSTLFSVPLPKNDTVTFSFTVPSSAAVGSTFIVEPFAENRDGLRGAGQQVSVRVAALGADTQAPLVYQTVPPRLELGDSLDLTARDPDGLVRIIGFLAKDSAGVLLFTSSDTLAQQAQQVVRRKAFLLPTSLRGRGMFIVGFATDASGHTGFAVPNGATVPVTSDSLAKRDATVYAYGLTTPLPTGSLGADIAVDTARARVYVSNINKNELEVFNYGNTLSALPPVGVGAMPWGMAIDNSGSLLLVANSGGTNISKVSLVTRTETGRVKTTNEYLFDVSYTKDETSGGFKYKVSAPIQYSDRPQYIAQSASGALYYSTRPTSTATPGTLRRIDNFLDPRTEPRQIWQYGTYSKGHYIIINSDAVDVIEGQNGVSDKIIICDHTPGQEQSTAVCVTNNEIPTAVAALRAAPVNANVQAVKDLSVESLSLPDTNFVAVGGDRRRVAFGEANTGGRAGRVLLVYDPSGTPAMQEQYSAPVQVYDLTNNASDRVFGLAINQTSSNIVVHGVETFYSDSSLRLQGKFATFNTGAGIAFHPRNVDENTPDQSARVAFVASGDFSIQIVDSYTYRLRGRIPLRQNLYGALRAVEPTAAEKGADPTLVVKLFGLTPEGIVMIDVRTADIDNVKP